MPRFLRPLLLTAVLATLAVPAVADADVIHFTTPSGNIDCVGDFDVATVSCTVQRASWPRVPPRPAGCDVDWIGTDISLTRGRVVVGACRGDIGPQCVAQTGDCPALGYGRSLTLPRAFAAHRAARASPAGRGTGPGPASRCHDRATGSSARRSPLLRVGAGAVPVDHHGRLVADDPGVVTGGERGELAWAGTCGARRAA